MANDDACKIANNLVNKEGHASARDLGVKWVNFTCFTKKGNPLLYQQFAYCVVQSVPRSQSRAFFSPPIQTQVTSSKSSASGPSPGTTSEKAFLGMQTKLDLSTAAFSGQFSSSGVPRTSKILVNWFRSHFPSNRGFRVYSSANMHPQAHTSTGVA